MLRELTNSWARSRRLAGLLGASISMVLAWSALLPDTAQAQSTSSNTAVGSLATSVVSGAGNFVVMDSQGFWELLVRPQGSSAWALITPPGAPSDTGLVVGVPVAGPRVAAGFFADPELGYSPVEQLLSSGKWNPGLLPRALVTTSDAVAVGSGGQVIALAQDHRGGEVEVSKSGGSFHRAFTFASLTRAAKVRGCGRGALRGVVAGGGGEANYLLQCGPHKIVVTSSSGAGAWKTSAIAVGGKTALSVLGAFENQGGLRVVLEEKTGRSTLVASLTEGSRGWAGPRMRVAQGTAVSVGQAQGGSITLVARGRHNASQEYIESGNGYREMAGSPQGTQVISDLGSQGIYAFVSDGTNIDIWQLPSLGSSSWVKYQRLPLPQLQPGNPGATAG